MVPRRAKPKRPDAMAAARLIENLGRTLHSNGHSDGMFPAQWAALRYFALAKSPHDTAMSLANYQGLAFGSVARTVRTMIDKGYLKKDGSAGRGRAERIAVTDSGHALLKRDPLRAVALALESLTSEQLEMTVTAAEAVLRTLHTGEPARNLDAA
jgi:DNA-binding MarR family transcriptional regulator